MSPFCPQWTFRNAPLAELAAYHQSPFDGLNTAKSPLPSPSKSPTSGRSPAAPNTTGVACCCGFELAMRYHVLLEGRYRTKSARPSPSKSDGLGMSPANPYVFRIKPPLTLLRNHHC